MLVSAQIANTPSVARLIRLWAGLYVPDLSSLPQTQDPSVHGELVRASSLEGRALITAKLRESLININCQFGAIQAKGLYEYIPTVLDLNEARRLTEFAFRVYLELLKLYQQPASTSAASTQKLLATGSYNSSLSTWGIPDIAALANSIEPVLLEFQEQHIASKDWVTLGFITTLLNLCNQAFLSKLTPVEQVLIRPYFKFVEEQVAVPWQRVCAAAAKHKLDSPALILVQQMLPASPEIAKVTYERLVQMLPEHRSRRGKLNNPGITHSCLRDLAMFQAYLWLCVLEGNTIPVERELVTLCVMVMERMGVKWEMTALWNQLLFDEILSRVNPEQKSVLLPVVQKIQEVFYQMRGQTGNAVHTAPTLILHSP